MAATNKPILPPAPEWVRAKEWTPEQQAQELLRRMTFSRQVFTLGSALTPRPTDVIVSTPPKAGTTWLTYICHQIRMGGAEPDFEASEDVIAVPEILSALMGIDPNTFPQPADPRVFHTHFSYSIAPKGGRFIYCMREPKDLVLSRFRFADQTMSLKGRVALPLFCNIQTKAGFMKQILSDLVEWWEHRNDEDVLFLFFDDLKEDHIGCVRRIAKFIGVDCSEEVISRVVFTTTHAEMARHHSKFDSRKSTEKFAEMFGDDPPTELVGRVRKNGGTSGEGQKVLPQEFVQYSEDVWKEIVTEKLGFKDVNEMRQTWNKERAN